MTWRDDMPFDREKEELYRFCTECESLFLYGAGYWAEKLYYYLVDKYVSISGFIVTKLSSNNTYMGLPVIDVSSFANSITAEKNVHILMAFEDPDMQSVKDALPEKNINFHQIPINVLRWIVNEKNYGQLINTINSNFRAEKVNCSKISEHSKVKNILIIRIDVMGDLVCSTALLREVKHNYPDASVTFIVNSKFKGLFLDCPFIDTIIGYNTKDDKGDFYHRLSEVAGDEIRVKSFIEINALGDKIFDMVILPRALMTGSSCVEELILALVCDSKIRIAHLIDLKTNECEKIQYEILKKYFTHLVLQETQMHETEYQLDMLEKSGFEIGSWKNELWISNERKRIAREYLSKWLKTPRELICMGMVGSVPVKNWAKEHFREWIRLVEEKYGERFCFVLLGGDDAKETAEYIAADDNNCINLSGKTEIELTVSIISLCEIYVGIDTGLMHVADALGIKSIALFHSLPDREGVLSYGPGRWGARTIGSVMVEPEKGIDGCSKYCRKNKAHCVNTITPERVLGIFEGVV